MTDTDQSAFVRSSSAAAKVCQRRYLFWVRVHLSILGLTGLVAAWSAGSEFHGRVISGVVALMMFGALAVGSLLKLARLDEAWFRTRALAENGKAAAWRFAMKPKPLVTKQDENEEKSFLAELDRVRRRFPQVAKYLAANAVDGPEITPEMRKLRCSSVEARLAVYVRFRLKDQTDWYQQRAKNNADAEWRWFLLIFLIEVLAIVAAVVRIITTLGYNPVGAIAAIAGCFIAWSQTKRFSDLASAYGVAWQDLVGLQAGVASVYDEAALEQLVMDVESAISREHRLWLGKRTT